MLSNGFSAEFGRAMGGVVNTVTKSGSNDVHGTGYWFFRNRTLEAADRYANGIKAPEWRHTAGASVGGAIKKDKLFYFAELRLHRPQFPGPEPHRQQRPSPIADGQLHSGANCVPTTAAGGPTQAQCAAAIKFIQKQMNVLVPRTYNQELGFAKIDWRPTDRNYVQLRSERDALGFAARHSDAGRADQREHARQQRQLHRAGQVRQGLLDFGVTNNSVNELRFGWFKDRLSDPGASDLFRPRPARSTSQLPAAP